MEIGQVINEETIGQRAFEPRELAKALLKGARLTVASWGAHEWVVNKELWLRFKVQGHHHKGFVYIILGWNDTFTVYYTDFAGLIIDKKEEVYVDELVEVIDRRVEWIEDYK